MENKDFNFEEIKRRLENYEEAPNPKMWQKIEKQIKPNNFLLKTAIALSSLLLVAFIGVLIFTPSQKFETKQVASNTKTVEKKSKEKLKNPKENFNKAKENFANPKEKNLEIVEEKTLVLTSTQKEVKTETQEVKKTEEKQEIALKTPKKAEIKQKEITPIVEEKIAEQKHEEKTPEQELEINRTQLFIPNAFTPNSGNENSIFKPAFTELRDYRMDIYNSNGILVFTTNNIEEGWNGYYKGELQPMAVYVYIVRFTNNNGVLSTQKGKLMLVR